MVVPTQACYGRCCHRRGIVPVDDAREVEGLYDIVRSDEVSPGCCDSGKEKRKPMSSTSRQPTHPMDLRHLRLCRTTILVITVAVVVVVRKAYHAHLLHLTRTVSIENSTA